MKSIMASLWRAFVEASTSTLPKPVSRPVEPSVPARAAGFVASPAPLGAHRPEPQTGGVGSADARFFKRQRLARIVMLVGILVGALADFGSTSGAQASWPALAPWSPWLSLAGSGAFVAALIWSMRCTLCGGGLKLNGRTCSKCAHEFSRAA